MVRNIDQLATQAKLNTETKENLIKEYIPFIMSCAQKISGRYIDSANDEEYSIALEAFSEAIDQYQEEKGSFLTFAHYVIKCRLYDYFRKAKKHKEHEVFDDIESEQSQIVSINDKISSNRYFEETKNNDLALEITMLRDKLLEWNITFNDLSEISPKHKRTRKMCIKIGMYISEDKILLKSFMDNKLLPSKKIQEIFKIPIKKFERFRKYIIAVVIIKCGDYEQISEYIKD